jgi:hypothetical protein
MTTKRLKATKCSTNYRRCSNLHVPTKKRRYMITDTGETSAMLDTAGRAWPETADRKAFLLRLAATGHEAIARQLTDRDAEKPRTRQREAMELASRLVDADLLLSDVAWR